MATQQMSPNSYLTEGDLEAELICKENGYELHRIDLVSLSSSKYLSKRSMMRICQMYNIRDERISSA
jgi:hypothetical protein